MKISSRTTLWLSILLLPLLFMGCKSLEEDPTKDWSAEELYVNAKGNLDDRFYDQAIQMYKDLDLRYPYGPYAEQGKIDIAYLYWKRNEPALALMACDRFIREHPQNKHVDYVMYLKAMVHFNDDKGLLGVFATKELSERDPGAARQAFDILRELVMRFPESKYAEDSQLRMAYLVNALAQHEVAVAEYYYRRGAYVASINRAQTVIQTYPKAPSARNALELLALSYEKSGLFESQNKVNKIMDINFPGLREAMSEEESSSWWSLWRDNSGSGEVVDSGDSTLAGAPPWWKFWVDEGAPPVTE